MKVFLTGATGFLGSHILARLVQSGHQVVAWRRGTSSTAGVIKTFRGYGMGDADLAGVRWLVKEADALGAEDMKGCDAVIHAAALVSFFRADAGRLMAVNVELTARLLELAAVQQLPFHYISSAAVLDRRAGRPLREEDRARDPSVLSFYGRSKWHAERMVMAYHRTVAGGVILRPSVILGWGDSRRSSLEIVRSVAAGLLFYPPGKGAFVNAKDVASVLLWRMRQPPATWTPPWNVVGFECAYRELMTALAQALGVRPPRLPVPLPLLWPLGWISDGMYRWTGRARGIPLDVIRVLGRTVHYDVGRLRRGYPLPLAGLAETARDAAQSEM